jgi:hypothetical protein
MQQAGEKEIIETMREIMRDNECNSETNNQKSGFEECQVAPGATPENGHLAPEIKMANEIIRDHGTSCTPLFL